MYKNCPGRTRKRGGKVIIPCIVLFAQLSDCLVFGVLTQEYSYDTGNCQILITVPECLETIFMSPPSNGEGGTRKYMHHKCT